MTIELASKAEKIFGAAVMTPLKPKKSDVERILFNISKTNKNNKDLLAFQWLQDRARNLVNHKGEEVAMKFIVGWIEMVK